MNEQRQKRKEQSQKKKETNRQTKRDKAKRKQQKRKKESKIRDFEKKWRGNPRKRKSHKTRSSSNHRQRQPGQQTAENTADEQVYNQAELKEEEQEPVILDELVKSIKPELIRLMKELGAARKGRLHFTAIDINRFLNKEIEDLDDELAKSWALTPETLEEIHKRKKKNQRVNRMFKFTYRQITNCIMEKQPKSTRYINQWIINKVDVTTPLKDKSHEENRRLILECSNKQPFQDGMDPWMPNDENESSFNETYIPTANGELRIKRSKVYQDIGKDDESDYDEYNPEHEHRNKDTFRKNNRNNDRHAGKYLEERLNNTGLKECQIPLDETCNLLIRHRYDDLRRDNNGKDEELKVLLDWGSTISTITVSVAEKIKELTGHTFGWRKGSGFGVENSSGKINGFTGQYMILPIRIINTGNYKMIKWYISPTYEATYQVILGRYDMKRIGYILAIQLTSDVILFRNVNKHREEKDYEQKTGDIVAKLDKIGLGDTFTVAIRGQNWDNLDEQFALNFANEPLSTNQNEQKYDNDENKSESNKPMSPRQVDSEWWDNIPIKKPTLKQSRNTPEDKEKMYYEKITEQVADQDDWYEDQRVAYDQISEQHQLISTYKDRIQKRKLVSNNTIQKQKQDIKKKWAQIRALDKRSMNSSRVSLRNGHGISQITDGSSSISEVMGSFIEETDSSDIESSDDDDELEMSDSDDEETGRLHEGIKCKHKECRNKKQCSRRCID